MFVQLRLKTQGAVALATGLALGACSDPTAFTDLRPEGDPEVLAVLVMNDPGGVGESPTFCKLGDDKRPGLVEGIQVCPDDLTAQVDPVSDAQPLFWATRVMFDELLNPDIEDLLPILENADNDPATPETPTGTFTGSLLATQPVILRCGLTGTTPVVVAYDGHYGPNGNNVTFPLGPSLFIQPTDFAAIAAGSECTVELRDNIVDKDNRTVPAAQRGADGIYAFSVAPLAQAEESIADGDEDIDPTAPLEVAFNGFIDPDTFTANEITIKQGASCEAAADVHPAKIEGEAGSPIVAISITDAATATNAWNPGVFYVVTFNAGAAVADLAGGPADVSGFEICFSTAAP